MASTYPSGDHLKNAVKDRMSAGRPTRPERSVGAGRPARKPVTRGVNTGPGARPGGPHESPPQGQGGMPSFVQHIEQFIGQLAPEMQALARQHIGDFPGRVQGAIDRGMLPFHPALDHTHGPDGAMLPPVGMGGLKPNAPQSSDRKPNTPF